MIVEKNFTSAVDPFQLRIDGRMYSEPVMRYLTAATEKEQAQALSAVITDARDGQYFRLSWQGISGASEYQVLVSEQENPVSQS